MVATAQFSESLGKYVVVFPDGKLGEFIQLDDVALLCDKHKWELHYKGKIA